MAQQEVNLTKDKRCSVSCPSSSKDTYSIRLRRLTLQNLRNAFGIPSNINFFLINKSNETEFPNDDGLFDADPNTLYNIQFCKALMVTNDKNMKSKPTIGNDDTKEIDWNESHLLDLSGGGGGSAGINYILTCNHIDIDHNINSYRSISIYCTKWSHSNIISSNLYK